MKVFDPIRFAWSPASFDLSPFEAIFEFFKHRTPHVLRAVTVKASILFAYSFFAGTLYSFSP